jgi:hypothetical protein
LYYSADGVLIKDVADDMPGGGGNLPSTGGGNDGSGDGNLHSNGGGNDGGNDGGGTQPNPSTPAADDYPTMMKSFIAQRYPGARIIGLPDYERNSVEYDIVDGTVGREVVFDLVAVWRYTETEVRRSDVPQIVMNALLATEYATWEIDDVSFFETAAYGDYYLFEMESRNDKEKNVKISKEGKIL